MAGFFIDRPIFAIVISLLLTLGGVLSLLGLPVAQYPEITPPTVRVNAAYPGASAETVEQSVTTLLDSQINGVADLRYIRSVSGDDGTSSIAVVFALERDADIAAVETQNRVSQVLPRLPAEVTSTGVSVTKATPDTLLYLAVHSPDDAYSGDFLSNYAYSFLVDPLKRTVGVGDVKVFGYEYGMRVWLRPDRMTSLDITTADIIQAIQEQNKQAAAGRVGEPPGGMDSGFAFALRATGRLVTEQEFADVILRARPDGSFLRLGDVARVELGAQGYGFVGSLDGSPAAVLGISLSPGANALESAAAVRSTLESLSQAFPPGLDYTVVYDNSVFVEESISEVVHTFFEALLLVLLVVFLFLQNIRATLIPMIAVPVSLLATFISYQFLGFSINTLSLFALVLAIGIVVDDAIVVVEAVEHKMAGGMAPREATREAMDEVTGPIVATSLVLAAIFLPMALVPGVVGQLYQQFALTIAVSVAFSTIVALSLTPALCASLLRPRTAEPEAGPAARFFAAFNRQFERLTLGYVRLAAVGTGAPRRVFLGLLVLLAGLLMLVRATPGSFVPDEDIGAFFAAVTLPEAATLARTEAVTAAYTSDLAQLPGVESVLSIAGFDVVSGTTTANAALMIVKLQPWEDRTQPDTQAAALIRQATRLGFGHPEASIFAFNPPALPGFGAVSGFSLMLQGRAGQTPSELSAMAQEFIRAAQQRPEIGRISTSFGTNTPNYQVTVDREKAKKLGIPVSDVYGTLQIMLGSYQVNDFTRFGRNYRVILQADGPYRSGIDALAQLFIRSSSGEMVPLNTLVAAEPGTGPRFTLRYNLFPAAELSGSPAPGYSSGQAMQALREVASDVLTSDFGYEWSGQSLEESEAGNTAVLVLLLSALVVFLLLAALYESWSIPAAVMLAVPFGILGAFVALLLRDLSFDVYGQIGLVTLVGLGAKNAILIVEFAKQFHEQGRTAAQAALEAARLRLRPIVMTSFAFIMGVVPLVLASGAGAASKQAVGTAVFGGMLAATLLAVLFVPAFFVLVQRDAGAASSPVKEQGQ
jgi:hydrophobe/amphiphile efflux-1 (HAE1) family protein